MGVKQHDDPPFEQLQFDVDPPVEAKYRVTLYSDERGYEHEVLSEITTIDGVPGVLSDFADRAAHQGVVLSRRDLSGWVGMRPFRAGSPPSIWRATAVAIKE